MNPPQIVMETRIAHERDLLRRSVRQEVKATPVFIDETKLNTHYYDSFIKERLEFIQDLLVWASDISQEEMDRCFHSLRGDLNDESKKCFDLVVRDAGKSDNNFVVYADRLLYILARYATDLKDHSGKKNVSLAKTAHSHLVTSLNNQFTEMLSGTCPPGRVNRLAQALVAVEAEMRADQIYDEVIDALKDNKTTFFLNPSWSSDSAIMDTGTIRAVLYNTLFRVWLDIGRYVTAKPEVTPLGGEKLRIQKIQFDIIQPSRKELVSKPVALDWFLNLDKTIRGVLENPGAPTEVPTPKGMYSVEDLASLLVHSKPIVETNTNGKYTIDHNRNLILMEGIYL